MTWELLGDELGRSRTYTEDPSALYRPSDQRITELAAMPYVIYLQTGEWRETRKQALKAAEHKCERCGHRDKTLDVHHITYQRRGRELPEDLQVLCRPCHRDEHGRSF